MTMVGPLAWCIRADQITQAFARFDVDGVLVGTECAVAVFQFAPEAMEMDRVLHHRIVDQDNAHTLTEFETDWFRVGELLAVEAPNEALHVACEMQLHFAIRRSR